MRSRIGIMMLVMMIIISSMTMSYSEDAYEPDIPVPVFKAEKGEDGTIDEIEGYHKGLELLTSSYYTDIATDPFEEDIIRMSALGVVDNHGSKEYRPAAKATKYEALTYLVRAAGRGEAVVQRVLPQTMGMSQQEVVSLYNEEYFNEALALGIITEDETRDMNGPVSRELTAVWTARAIGLQPVYSEMHSIYSLNDWVDIDPSYRPFVEAALSERIMYPNNDGYFKPQDNISRGELAFVLANGYKTIYDKNKIEARYGLVTSVNNTSGFEGNDKVDKRDILVRNVDGTSTNVVAKYNHGNRKKNDFVVFKDGYATDSKSISTGDQIEYLIKDGEVIYVSIVDDETIMDKMYKTRDNAENTKTYFGTVSKIIDEVVQTDTEYLKVQRVRVNNHDGQIFDIQVETDLQTNIKNDIIVFKDGEVSGTDLLEEGDRVEYVVKDGKYVIYINASELESQEISGTVRSIQTNPDATGTTITIFDYNDVIREYPVADYATVRINEGLAKLGDLNYGQDVKLTVNNGYVTWIDSTVFTEEPGYIPEFGKMRMGEIYRIYQDSLMIIQSDGSKNQFKISGNVKIYKSGGQISYSGLREGDMVKLYFSDIYSETVEKIEVEGAERLIKAVYTGELINVNETTNTITLREPYYLKNGQWERVGINVKEIKLASNVSLYDKDMPIKIENLSRDYKNGILYIATENSYGTELGIKGNVNTGGEMFYNAGVKKIDRALGKIELDNKINVNLTEGTIFIKDGRMLSEDTLTSRDKLFVIADFVGGDNYANVVNVVSPMGSIFSRINLGAIETVGINELRMKNYTTVNNNYFNSIKTDTSDRFYYNNKTVINDVTDLKDIESIKPYEFFHGSYSRLENKSKDSYGLEYKRYYTLFVTDSNGQILAMNIRHKGLLDGQKIDDRSKKESEIAEKLEETTDDFTFTRGIVTEVNTKWERVRLTDSNDWAPKLGEWSMNRTDTYFEYIEETMFIKGDKVITIDDIKEGDQLYIMRLKEEAYIVFVE